jgi:hypothetical protein
MAFGAGVALEECTPETCTWEVVVASDDDATVTDALEDLGATALYQGFAASAIMVAMMA